MKHLISKIKNRKFTITLIISFFCVLSIFIFSAQIGNAISQSIENCLEIIIPGIFPMMFITTFITKTGFSQSIHKRLHKLLSALFGTEGTSVEAIITGLTGGYNIAVSSACNLLERGIISATSARRIALYFTNPGIAFTVNVTGIALFNNVKTGIRFYLISATVCTVTAFINNAKHKNSCAVKTSENKESLSQNFVNSVLFSSQGIINICFSMILFSAFGAIVTNIIPIKALSGLFIALSEVSSGVIYSTENYPAYITLFVLVFGGFCVYIQNISLLEKLHIGFKDYFSVRLLQASLCTLVEYIFCKLSPETVSTAANNVILAPHKSSSLGSAALIFLCIIFMIEVRRLRTSGKIRH